MRNQTSKKLCDGCEKFTAKFRQWDERKVPKVSLVNYAECKECRMTYTIYKKMILPNQVKNKVIS